MASMVQICNLALSHVGSRARISSLSEQSEEAYFCNLHLASVRDALLQEHPWTFANKIVALSATGTPPGDWSYQYAYPADCLQAIALLASSRTATPLPFKVQLSGTSKVILTDVPQAYLRYTAAITNSTLFDPQFVEALALKLAATIALPITGDKQVRQQCIALYTQAMQRATAANAREGVDDDLQDASWIRARS